MQKIIATHRSCWSDRQFVSSIIIGILFFAVSLFVNHAAGIYATHKAGNNVEDLLLDRLPVVNVDFMFNQGAIALWIFTLGLLVIEPRRIPFLLKATALFIIIRSGFVTLTHLGPSPERAIINPNDFVEKFTYGGDLFFSGHTGLPFLVALIFWRHKILRIIFLAASVVFGVSVLLGHLHYSIDVFAAFFITYGIFEVAKRFFAKDYHLLIAGTLSQ